MCAFVNKSPFHRNLYYFLKRKHILRPAFTKKFHEQISTTKGFDRSIPRAASSECENHKHKFTLILFSYLITIFVTCNYVSPRAFSPIWGNICTKDAETHHVLLRCPKKAPRLHYRASSLNRSSSVPLCSYYVMTATSKARVIKDTSTSQERR